MISNPAYLIGKTILIGITSCDAQGEIVSQSQMHGVIAEATEERFMIRLSCGSKYTLPPDYRNVFPAKPDEYRLRSTGEVVVDPDFTTSWTVHSPKRTEL